MTTHLDERAVAIGEAARRHAAAVAAQDPEARAEAGRRLVDALDAYGLALLSEGVEAPPGLAEFEDALDERDGVEHPDPEPDPRERLALFVRADLAVTDLDRLRSVAAQGLSDCCGAGPQEAEQEVRVPASALVHLFSHERPVLEPERLAPLGVEVLFEACVAVAGVDDPHEVEHDLWEPLDDARRSWAAEGG